ncbi:MAG: Trm112 family protein [Syntrophotaleaceae bacterium]
MTLSPELLAILVCPKCKGPLLYREVQELLICETCRLAYPIRDGIPVMLIEEAVEIPREE